MSEVCYLVDPEEMLKASERGDVNKVRELLGRDSTLVNAKGAHNKTPLHWAAENGHKAVVELLLAHGADLSARDHFNFTALDLALKAGHVESAELLRKANSSLRSK
jgi:ankyrin repeat protein